METGSCPKGGPAEAETKAPPLTPRHWRPHSFLAPCMVVIRFRTEPNLLITGMLDRGYLFIYFSFIPELSQEKLHSHGREGDQLSLAAGKGGGLGSRASNTVIAVRCRQIGKSAGQAQAD